MPLPAFPDPRRAYPITLPDGSPHKGTVFLNRVIDHPRLQVGDFTYASDFDAPDNWAARLAPYLFDTSPERLIIGRYGQIAHGVRFITASANHATQGVTTFPFPVFDPARIGSYHPDMRDTVIGHDVWFGYGALVLPGATIGSGVIVGAGAVVRGSIPDFAVVTGNPAQIVRMRFTPAQIDALLELAWCDRDPDWVAMHQDALLAADIGALQRAAGGA